MVGGEDRPDLIVDDKWLGATEGNKVIAGLGEEDGPEVVLDDDNGLGALVGDE
jgi:hypothetical protein